MCFALMRKGCQALEPRSKKSKKFYKRKKVDFKMSEVSKIFLNKGGTTALYDRPFVLPSLLRGGDTSGRFFCGFVAFSIHREKAYETRCPKGVWKNYETILF